MANRLIHRRFQRAVGQIAGTGFFEATADAGLGHQRRALGDFLDPGEDLLRIGHFRRANEIQHLRLRLDNVGGDAAGIGDGVVHPRLFDNMFVKEVAAGGHQRHGIQRAAAQMRRVCRVRRSAGKPPRRLNVGTAASTSSNNPSRTIKVLPEPPSSPGQP